jgi:hypothetical protein
MGESGRAELEEAERIWSAICEQLHPRSSINTNKALALVGLWDERLKAIHEERESAGDSLAH